MDSPRRGAVVAVPPILGVVALLGLVAAGCASPGHPGPTSLGAAAGHPRSIPSAPLPTAPPPASAPSSTTLPAPSSAATTAPSLVDHLTDVGSAGQVVVVTATDYGETTATLSAYQRSNAGWHQVFGPWEANLGDNGFAPPGAKTEGDGRTPSGAYGFDFAFGIDGDPGVSLPFRQITGPNIVWDDDPASPSYNEWVDDRGQSPGANPESMEQSPAYDEGVVIAYNTARTPGLGSAVFLHESTGGPTAGCVSLPAPELLQVLRWLDPSRQPRIVMGTLSALTS